MSVLSMLNKIDGRVLIPILVAFALLLRNVSSTLPVSSDVEDSEVKTEELPFCDEKLINDRDANKRFYINIKIIV